MNSFFQGFQLVPHWAYLFVVTWFGAMVGSFLNCFIYRWPRRISVWKKKRSFCPHCKAQIAWYDNFPLLSWIVLRARCRHCKEPIHWIYPVIEALTAGLTLSRSARASQARCRGAPITMSLRIGSIRRSFGASTAPAE